MNRGVAGIAALLLAVSVRGASPAVLRASAPPARSQPVRLADGELEARIARIAAGVPGRVGVSAVLVESGRHAGLREREPFVLQSTFKLFVAAAALASIDHGALRFDTPVALRARDMSPGVSALTDAHPLGGFSPSVHELLEDMIVRSDNTACDALLRRVGGPAAVTAWLAAHGISDVRIDRGEFELGNDWYGFMPPRPRARWTAARLRAMREAVPARVRTAAAAAFVGDPRDHGAPAGFTRFLAMLERRDVLRRSSADTLLALLSRCATGGARLPGALPKQARVAHKTGTGGTWAGRTNAVNDVGLITLPGGGGHVAIAVLVTDLRGPIPHAEKAIAEIARAVFDAWNAPE